jgi:hypothetical protein
MKLISWRHLNDPCQNYELIVEVENLEFDMEQGHFWHKYIKIYWGHDCWHNRATGYEVSCQRKKDLDALRRRIEWGDFRDLEKT